MNVNNSSFNQRRLAACGLVGLSSLVAVFYGCSSSSNTPVTPVTPVETPDSGGPDSTVSPEPDSAAPTPDSGKPGDGGALVLQKVTQTKLFADTPDGGAPNVDPNLVNPWGLAFNPAGIAWVSDNHAGVLTLYKTNQATPVSLVVQVPLSGGDAGAIYPAADSGTLATPTGQVFNASAAVPEAGTTNDFMGDLFIVSTEDGTISGWAPTLVDRTKATLRVDMTGAGAIFKGLQIIPSTPPVLLAADFHNGVIDAFDTNYAPITADAGAAKWIDSTVPAGYAPFNIGTAGTNVFVAYAKQDAAKEDDDKGPGHGAVSVFDLSGTLIKSLIPQSDSSALNSPWALTTVPSGGWGSLPAGSLLVGNFGDGLIHAYDPSSGALVGTMVTGAGSQLIIEGLWSLVWGANAPEAGTTPDQLYFTAGPNDENNGLYGYLTVAP